jgi:hypothetical protein
MKFPGTIVPLFSNPSPCIHMMMRFIFYRPQLLMKMILILTKIGSQLIMLKCHPWWAIYFWTSQTQSISSFATEYDSWGCCSLRKHEICLDSRTPIFSHPYRKSIKARELLQSDIQSDIPLFLCLRKTILYGCALITAVWTKSPSPNNGLCRELMTY